MHRLFALVLPALLAGCIASAAAEDGVEHDVITLSSGERLIGELVDVRDGRYWVLLTDGRMVSADFRTVTLVEMGGREAKVVAPADMPLPSWDERTTEHASRVGGGFDLGLQTGGRVRYRFNTPAVAHVDMKAGFAVLISGGGGAGFLSGGELALFGNSPVHLTFSAVAGPAIIFGSFYPFVGLGAGLQIDPRGPFEVHLGAQGGLTFSSFAWSPDLSVSWVW